MIIVESNLIGQITNKMKVLVLFFIVMFIFFYLEKYFETELLFVLYFACELLKWAEGVSSTIMREPQADKIDLEAAITVHALMLPFNGGKWQHGISNNSFKLLSLFKIQQLRLQLFKQLINLSIKISKAHLLLLILMKGIIDDN